MASSRRRSFSLLLLPRLLLASLLLSSVTAFYLPGVAPTDYKKGQDVPLYVNTLTPIMGNNATQQLKSVIAYDYYFDSFHFCQPKEGMVTERESLGSILFGDRIFNSPFSIEMFINSSCQFLCSSTVPAADATFINDRIREHYAMNWIIDGLPAATAKQDRNKRSFYSIGFDLGQYSDRTPQPELNTHYEIFIEYHTRDWKDFRVVGVIVFPKSRVTKLTPDGIPQCDKDAPKMVLNEKADNAIVYTYDVHWKYSVNAWATRWDNYLHVFDPQIHWFSLVNSVVIVLFLTGMVAMILQRALHKDISRYNAVEAQEDVQEDFGWKLVHGDVFRPPNYGMLLSVLLGNGAQLFCMTAVTLVFAVLGFLSPSNRGSLATVMIIFYMIFGSVAGFVSARVYKMLGGESWKSNVFLAAFLFPGVIFSMLVGLNFFLIAAESSGAVPFGTMISICALWFLVSVPLSFIGSYFGFKKPKIEHPVRTNQIPRQIPDQVFYLRPIPSMFMGGVLPFGAIFIELYFIMNSIWNHRIYYVFGFLFLVFMILILTCSEVTILMCYFHLCSEDYHWWWRAFLTSGASALYVMLYSMLYYASKLEIDSFTSTVLYFGWTSIMALLFFVLTGAIGWFSCFYFVRKIYGSIKID